MNMQLQKQDLCNEKMPDILAQWVKYTLKEEFDIIVQREIEQTGNLTLQTWKITAHNIIKKIRESRQMTNFLTNIQSLVDRDSCYLQLTSKISDNTNLQLSDPRQIEHSFHQNFNDDIVSIKLNALNMLHHSQLLHVIINSNHDISARSWEKINPRLRQCLHDNDMEIFTLSFKIHAKLINSMQPQVIKEGFMNLIDGANSFYSQNNSYAPYYDTVVDEQNLTKIIKICHLIVFTVNKTSHHFIKVGDKFSEQIMERFFEFLMLHTDENILGPYPIISAIDPRASWLQNALHGNSMQGHIFSKLFKPAFVRELVNNITNPGNCDNKFHFAKFTHSVEMLRLTMKYRQGRSLFPIPNDFDGEPAITIEQVYLRIIKHLSDGNTTGTRVLVDMLVDGVNICLQIGILNNDSLMMKEIMKPLPLALPTHLIRVLETLVQSKTGIRCLINADEAKNLLDYTTSVLNEQINCTFNEKSALLCICGTILADHIGLIKNMESPIISKIIKSFQEEKFTKKDAKSNFEDALFQCISKMGSTPLGMYALSCEPGLVEELAFIWSSSGRVEHLRCLSLARLLDLDRISPGLLPLPPLLPLVMTRSRDRSNHRNSELSKFLRGSRGVPHDSIWHTQLRTAFRASGRDPIVACVVIDLVEQLTRDIPLLQSRHPKYNLCAEGSSHLLEIAEWVVRYGESNNFLQSSQRNIDSLLEFLGSTDKDLDWFLATTFLLCGGHTDKCEAFLSKISSLPAGANLWPDRAYKKYHEQSFQFGHQLELIVEEEFPIASKALQMSGISWWYVAHKWMQHSYLTSLKWDQICQWLVFCLTSPSDQNLYYSIALLKHMEPMILKAVENRTIAQLIAKPIESFRITDYLGYIEKLSKRYGSILLWV